MIQKDPAKAMKWLKMAGKHGSAEAKARLAQIEQQKTLALLAWRINENNTITITDIKNKNVETIYVPALINKKKVSALGDDVFRDCKSLTEVYLPDSLQSISWGAFEHCTRLTKIHLPDSLQSIGAFAFIGCTSLIEIHLPGSLQSIGEYAFYGCTSLKEINLPNSLQLIDFQAFKNCHSLKKIHLTRKKYKIFQYKFPETAEFIIHD